MVICGRRMPSGAARMHFALLTRTGLLPVQARTMLAPNTTHTRSVVLAVSKESSPPQKSIPAVPPSDANSATSSPLERLRARQLRDVKRPAPDKLSSYGSSKRPLPKVPATPPVESFEELGLSEEILSAVRELRLSKPTEVQGLGIPAVLAGDSVVMASHTGSGKTLAYMLPVVQSLRTDEMESGMRTRARRPRCVVLCPTRELAEQVFHVAKSICHHARFRAAMIGGGTKMKLQEDALNSAVDMIVGTPGRLLMHIQEGHMAYGDIKYVALDEADTMFDRGFAPEIRKFLHPLRNRSNQPGDPGFQTVLVTATITKAVQKLLDEEFPGIRHIHTSSLHKKVASARHDFIKLSGTENKLEALQQVLEPSLMKGNRIMVFCNTVNSCRAVDHYIHETGLKTLNYHGEVPADERVLSLGKFKEENVRGPVPAFICTDLAARGLDLVVDHVIMFDFPYNSIDYLHRTGRTARMGAKGRVTSLVTKRDQILAEQLENAMSKGESLDTLTRNRPALETKKLPEHLQGRKKTLVQRGERGAARSAKFQAVVRSGFGANRPGKPSSPATQKGEGTGIKARFGSKSGKPGHRSKLSGRAVSSKR